MVNDIFRFSPDSFLKPWGNINFLDDIMVHVEYSTAEN